jgi:phosphohistidine swiveling domain-containing protein
MSIVKTLGLERALPTEELERLAEWLVSRQLDNAEFAGRLSSWFANFTQKSDKLLAARLLTKFEYYSQTLYEKKLADLGITLTQTLLDNTDDINNVTYIVADDHLDSSSSIAYHASKQESWSLTPDNVRKTSELGTGSIAIGSYVVLNDTQGSGNQFLDQIWPHVKSRVEQGARIYIACLELSDKAASVLAQLSPNVVLIPSFPSQHSLSHLVTNDYLSHEDARRVRELGERADAAMPLGYGDCGLLSAYHYQCPNNTLPIFWGNGKGSQGRRRWNSLFEYREKPKRPAPMTAKEARVKAGRGSTATADLSAVRMPTLRDLIESHDWITGAVNFDEDLHFSSFYLRASCKKYMTPQMQEYGYTSIVAIHQNFNETYYIRRDECISVAEALLRKIREKPEWLEDLLLQIAARAGDLAKVFPYDRASTPFRGMARSDILAIYRSHNRAHRLLYEVARIPEALDRGVGLFEKYLRDQLRERMGISSSDRRQLNCNFNLLTFPETASQVHTELAEFRDLVKEVQHAGQQAAFTSSSKRTMLKLDQALRTKIDRHRDKWSFWGYHGYGARALLDISYYVNRIASELTPGTPDEAKNYAKVLERAEERRTQLFRQLKIEKPLALLYRLYSRVGLAKLLRRYYQLRNFYFLDQLLDEIARQFETPEALVRSLLPDEIEGILSGERPLRQDYSQRIDHLVYVIHGQDEQVHAGAAKCTLVDGLLSKGSEAAASSAGTLTGTPISGGIARGRCKSLIRKEDASTVDFKPGDILVSESTDMDLYELIRQASGVITEAGGSTCHAAIVCRELNKPAIVGVRNALKRLKNNELVVLDANEGSITLSTIIERHFTIEDVAVFDEPVAQSGEKAGALSRLLRARFVVPRFFVIPWAGLATLYRTASSDAEGPTRRAVSIEIHSALEYLSGDMFTIRSSMWGEDSEQSASAGVWPTETGVLRADLVASFLRYVERFRGSDPISVSGSIIVQEMILGDASGVCFTEDPLHSESRRLVVEVIPGGNELLTDGLVSPMRYFVQRETRDVVLDESSRQWGSILGPTILQQLVERFFEIEALFGKPQDIEWTVKSGVIYVLQSRPITDGVSKSSDQRSSRRSVAGAELKNISSLYRAYRVPPNLQLHLLRVAALGTLIAENWKHVPLDHATLVTSLLLHDVGNIVKADYDKYPDLFPEEMKNLAYWKSVQYWVRTKFGETDVEASLAIARELNVPTTVLDLMARKLFVRNAETAVSHSWELKIAAYADQRIGPYGILPLEERFAEAKERYRGVAYASVNRSEYDSLVRYAYDIERQVEKHCALSLQEITDDMLQPIMERLHSFDITLTEPVAH